jgi:hypothetical protein
VPVEQVLVPWGGDSLWMSKSWHGERWSVSEIFAHLGWPIFPEYHRGMGMLLIDAPSPMLSSIAYILRISVPSAATPSGTPSDEARMV